MHPKDYGAKCDQCALAPCGPPVHPMRAAKPRAVIVGEAPGEEEAASGVPFVGKSGHELDTSLDVAGLPRNQVTILNAIACRPPKNDLDRIVGLIERENAARKRRNAAKLTAASKQGLLCSEPMESMLLTPQECCRPWLVHELGVAAASGCTDWIPLGNVATREILGTSQGIMALRAGMIEGGVLWNPEHNKLTLVEAEFGKTLPEGLTPVRVVPTLHPAFVLRRRRWTRAFRSDLSRASQWYSGTLHIHEPQIVYNPPAMELLQFLVTQPVQTIDVETDGLEPLLAHMRCLSVGNAQKVMSIGIRDIKQAPEGPTHCPACWGRGQIPKEHAHEALKAPAEWQGPKKYPNMAAPWSPMFYNVGPYNPAHSAYVECSRCGGTGRPPGEYCPFYTQKELRLVLQVTRWWLEHPQYIKGGHNSGSYDYLNLLSALGVRMDPNDDNIMRHSVAEPEHPHNLAYVSSIFAPATRLWKANREGKKKSTQSESNEELHRYCSLDVSNTDACREPLGKAASLRGQDHLIERIHKVQAVCRGMRMVGMRIDQDRQIKHEKALVSKVMAYRKQMIDIVGDANHNPGSTRQLTDLWFYKWKLIPPDDTGSGMLEDKIRYTEKGDPSTSDDVVAAMLTLPGLKEFQKKHLLFVRRWRKAMKLLATYVAKLRPMGQTYDLGWADLKAEDYAAIELVDETEVKVSDMAEYIEKKGYAGKGIVWADGRMRPGYSAHITSVGRLASGWPFNAQNVPKWLRDLVIPAPGHIFVSVDASQLHLRIAAALWQIKRYLEAFAAGVDPHSMVTAMGIFGEEFKKAAGWPCEANGWEWEGNAKEMRQIAKVVQYASMYAAIVETVFRIIRSTENKAGDLIYLDMKLKRVRQMHEAWLKSVPEVPAGWDLEKVLYKKQGFVQDPVWGRRTDFEDGPTDQDLANRRVLMLETALMNRSMLRVVDEIPHFKWGHGTGLLTQTHDSMLLEVPDTGVYYDAKGNPHASPHTPAWRALNFLGEVMNFEEPTLPGVRFEGVPKLSVNWAKAA